MRHFIINIIIITSISINFGYAQSNVERDRAASFIEEYGSGESIFGRTEVNIEYKDLKDKIKIISETNIVSTTNLYSEYVFYIDDLDLDSFEVEYIDTGRGGDEIIVLVKVMTKNEENLIKQFLKFVDQGSDYPEIRNEHVNRIEFKPHFSLSKVVADRYVIKVKTFLGIE